MKIYVDRREEDADLPSGLSLSEIIDRISSKSISSERVITKIRVDGKELLEDENGLYPDLNGDEIDSLEFQTGLPKEMAHQGLHDARIYLEKLNPGIGRTAELFRLGEEAKANEQYGRCIDGINWFIRILEGVRQVIGMNFQGMAFKEETVQSRIRKLQETIRGMWSAQLDEDWIMLADLLEYELLPIMEEWKEILPVIEKTARSSGKTAEKERDGNS
jgi:hypothetical protein